MANLGIVDLYNNGDAGDINKFNNRISSNLEVSIDSRKVDGDYEWLDIIEETLMYLDNILRNPNRFIVNEEDIVKIELARRVTVESIKHLARNTNLIQDIDKKTGDVKPSKILNINKEESFNTYENRFIYSLIQNIKQFVSLKKQTMVFESSNKDNKKFVYSGETSVGKEKVSVSMTLNSSMDDSSKIVNDDGKDISQRIEKLELHVSDLCNTDVYRDLARLHVALVTSPIKKTNLILKNVNFQYAVKLWNYLQEHVSDESSHEVKNKKTYEDNGPLKGYLDESFLLDYLVMDTLSNKNRDSSGAQQEISQRLIGNVVEKLIDINNEISEQQLKDIVAKQYTIIKNRNVVTDRKIQKIYKDAIQKYLNRINRLDINGVKDEREMDEIQTEQDS